MNLNLNLNLNLKYLIGTLKFRYSGKTIFRRVFKFSRFQQANMTKTFKFRDLSVLSFILFFYVGIKFRVLVFRDFFAIAKNVPLPFREFEYSTFPQFQ